MFTKDELLLINELVTEEIHKRKENNEYEYWNYDKELFESILKKIQDNSSN